MRRGVDGENVGIVRAMTSWHADCEQCFSELSVLSHARDALIEQCAKVALQGACVEPCSHAHCILGKANAWDIRKLKAKPKHEHREGK